jgi:osmotically-inducible protein OsmY
MKRFAMLAGAGAALMYFFDPRNGKRRRHVAADRSAAFFRRLARRAERAGRGVGASAYGTAMKLGHIREEDKPQPNDATLVQKVESEVFRDPSLPKGAVNLNAENGVVVIRGEVESEDLVRRLEEAVRDVKGVRGVENLLHVAGRPEEER